MSKRVSNSRSNRTPGKLRARQRVHLGWRMMRRRAIAFVAEAQRRLDEEKQNELEATENS